MKFLVLLLIAAVATAKPRSGVSEVEQIIAAIQSPSTNPATAAALEQMLQDLLGFEPIAVGPAIVDTVDPVVVVDQPSPIQVGPAIIDTVDPVTVVDHPAVIVEPTPVALPESVESTPIVEATPIAPLVQIILNINQAQSAPEVIPPAVVDVPIETPVAVDPVIVVDHAPVEPSPVIVAPAPVDPVVVVDQPSIIPDPVVLPTPVLPEVVPEPVVLPAPVLPEVIPTPVVLPSPVLPEPVVIPEAVITLPEELN
nr:cytadherence high molecular weight protein 3-like [Plodia interpunctella]